MMRPFVGKLVPLFFFLLLWEGLSLLVESLRNVAFPDPLDVAISLRDLVLGERLLDHHIAAHVHASLGRWVVGFGIAALFGVSYGLLAGWSRRFRDATLPILHLLQLIPGLAWIPVAILCFGIGEAATISMITVTAFTPIALNVLSGVEQVDETYLRAARMLGARRMALFLQVLLPGSLPSTLSGLRIGLGNGWRVLVAGEMIVGTGSGLGYAIIQARWTLDYESAFSCIAIICFIGLLVERLVFVPLENRTIHRWTLSGETP